MDFDEWYASKHWPPGMPKRTMREAWAASRVAERERFTTAHSAQLAAAVAAEREACRAVVEECIRTQAHLASNAREALSEASARIYKRGMA